MNHIDDRSSANRARRTAAAQDIGTAIACAEVAALVEDSRDLGFRADDARAQSLCPSATCRQRSHLTRDDLGRGGIRAEHRLGATVERSAEVLLEHPLDGEQQLKRGTADEREALQIRWGVCSRARHVGALYGRRGMRWRLSRHSGAAWEPISTASRRGLAGIAQARPEDALEACADATVSEHLAHAPSATELAHLGLRNLLMRVVIQPAHESGGRPADFLDWLLDWLLDRRSLESFLVVRRLADLASTCGPCTRACGVEATLELGTEGCCHARDTTSSRDDGRHFMSCRAHRWFFNGAGGTRWLKHRLQNRLPLLDNAECAEIP